MNDVNKYNLDPNIRYKVKAEFLTKEGSKLMAKASQTALKTNVNLPTRILRSTFKIRIKDLGHAIEYRAHDLVLRKELTKNSFDDDNSCLLYEHELTFLIKDVNLVYPDE